MDTTDERILYAIELAETGRQREAVNLLRHIAERQPGSVAAWKWLAYLSPDKGEALWALRTVERLAPNDPWLRSARPALLPPGYYDNPPPTTYERTRRQKKRHKRGCLGAIPAMLVLGSGIVVVLLVAVGAFLWQEDRAMVEASVAALLQLVETGDVTAGAPDAASQTGDADIVLTVEPEASVIPESAALVSDVQVASQEEYYQFEAETLAEVQSGLYSGGPSILDDEHAIAVTTYRLWVEWEAQQAPGTCQMTDAVVHLDVAYTYPQWVPTGHPDPALYDEWDRFMAHVTAHEEHHAALALECANTLADRLEQIGGLATCDMAEGQINVLVDEVYAGCEAQQAAFDQTEGRTTFPLP
jgi:predicted secreted Zn-dependent protease